LPSVDGIILSRLIFNFPKAHVALRNSLVQKIDTAPSSQLLQGNLGLSIHCKTSLGNITVKARRNTYGSYKKSLPCSVPQELFGMAKMRYFIETGMI
jgi:hypothetical protein